MNFFVFYIKIISYRDKWVLYDNCKTNKGISNKKRLTALELAKALEIPARTLGCYERNEILPGTKFYNLMIEKYGINVNWLLSGVGKMFINEETPKNEDSILKLQEEIRLSNDDMKTLIDILKSDASRSMLIKFIEIKKGNKEALESLIENLQGIKAMV